MDVLVSRAPTMRLSLHPTPPSETSAFSKIRAFSSRRAGLFPFRISVSSCSRSSPLSLTTYFFTETSFEAMIAPIAYSRDDSESQNLNPCKLIEAGDYSVVRRIRRDPPCPVGTEYCRHSITASGLRLAQQRLPW